MPSTWLSTDLQTAGLVVISTIGIFAAVIVSVRIVGLRSFSKMSSFDFAVTVAVGSIVATIAVSSSSLANGVIGLVTLLGCQWVVAQGRRRYGWESVVDNTPMLLMEHGKVLQHNLDRARITNNDLIAKLREANCLRLADARAVVLETTGDVSVLHGGEIDDELLEDVVR